MMTLMGYGCFSINLLAQCNAYLGPLLQDSCFKTIQLEILTTKINTLFLRGSY